MDIVLIILRIAHIFSAIYWIGAGFFILFIFNPTLRRASGPEKAVLGRIPQQLTKTIAPAATLTVLAGLILFFRYWANSADAWNSNSVKVFGLGGLAGIAAVVVGAAFIGRFSEQLIALYQQTASAGGPPSADLRSQIEKVEASLAMWSRVDFVLSITAVICMATARYVG
jgi:uncharacterized membrane protein